VRNLILALLILCCPRLSYADTPCVAQDYSDPKKEPEWDCPAPGEDALVPKLDITTATVSLTKDGKAPFSGLLLEKERVIQLGIRITALRRLLWLQMRESSQLMKVEIDHAGSEARLDSQIAAEQRDSCRKQLAATESVVMKSGAWYKSWTFGFALGVGLSAIIGTSIAVVVH